MLEVTGLEVVYHSVLLVLRGVSLRVGEGQVVALLGSNGAGKTTTMRALTGLLPIQNGRITKGSVTFGGASLNGMRPDAIIRLGVAQVMEGRRIFADLTVEENLRAGGILASRSDVKARIAEFYGRFPILGQRRHQAAGYLSGGEQQMLAIARALMVRPKLLLMDEPSLGLAPLLVRQVGELVRELNAQDGMSILLVEQNARMALELADYGYVLESGKVAFDGDAATLLADEDIQAFYLGVGDDAAESFRDVKRYRRRKRWLS